MNEQDKHWEELIRGLRSGDQACCTEFWNRYGEMLQNVAQNQLSAQLQRRVGSDDVVQSACRTFFRRISSGQFELPDADALWRLMCAITVTKARRAARDHHRQKRGMDKEQYIDAVAEGEPEFQLTGKSESPLNALEFSEQMEQLLAALNSQECQVLDLKLQNYNNQEIADQMQCSERTVRRITKNLQDRWTAFFHDA